MQITRRTGVLVVGLGLTACVVGDHSPSQVDLPACADTVPKAKQTPTGQPRFGSIVPSTTGQEPTDQSISPSLTARGFHLASRPPSIDTGLPPSPSPPVTANAYEDGVRQAVGAHWVYPREAFQRGQTGQVELQYKVVKDGSVRCVSVVHSSGVAVLDQAAVNALRDAVLPSPPEAWIAIPLRINFTYELGAAQAP